RGAALRRAPPSLGSGSTGALARGTHAERDPGVVLRRAPRVSARRARGGGAPPRGVFRARPVGSRRRGPVRAGLAGAAPGAWPRAPRQGVRRSAAAVLPGTVVTGEPRVMDPRGSRDETQLVPSAASGMSRAEASSVASERAEASTWGRTFRANHSAD